VSLTSAGKIGAAEYIGDKGLAPSTSDALQTTSGKYTGGIVLVAPDNSNVTITATMSTGGVNSAIISKTLQMVTADGGKTWSCTSGATNGLSAKYLPSACR